MEQNENLITKTAKLAVFVVQEYLKDGAFAIDATCGNGNDTIALSRMVGPSGRVLAMDVQGEALKTTEERLREQGIGNVELVRDSFVRMEAYCREQEPSAVIFNLGYLPGGDHEITTTAEVTLEGLRAALRILRPGGIAAVTMYSGHPAGEEEKQSVLAFAEALPKREYHAAYVQMLNQKGHPPEILWITKKIS